MASEVVDSYIAMPGSYEPHDNGDLWPPPEKSSQPALDLDSEELRDATPTSVHAGSSLLDLTEYDADTDLHEDGWHNFEPPTVLRKIPVASSRIILDIVNISIDNVKLQVQDAEQRKYEEKQQLEAEVARQKEIEVKEAYLPIIIAEETAGQPSGSDERTTQERESGSDVPCKTDILPDNAPRRANSQSSIWPMLREEKKHKSAIRRLFKRHGKEELGESSATGSAREALRTKLEAKLMSHLDVDNADPTTQDTIEALRKVGIFKTSDPSLLVECVSCLDEFPRRDMIKVPCHHYCSDCFVRLVIASTQNEQHWPPKCCLNAIPFRTIHRNVPKEVAKTFRETAAERSIPISERVYCHQPECSLWILPQNIDLVNNQGRCEHGHATCTICRGPTHGQRDCPQDHNLQLTNLLAEEEGWRRCFNCQALVEHREACQHMTCRCGTEFCYVCGLRWRTCGCSMQQLQALKDSAENRREQRRFREQAEADELREILAQIERFEIEEAEREEIRRQEEIREAEERRLREIEERVRKESIRRREIELKFEQLGQGLVELHELQRIMLQTYQAEAAKDLVSESTVKTAALAQEQAASRAEMSAAIEEKLSAREASFDLDYASRVAQERQIEREYYKKLEAYWSGKDDAERAIQDAMLPLRKRMDQGHQAWQKRKFDLLSMYRAEMEEEQALREEIMYSVRHRLRDFHMEEKKKLARRIAADERWFQAIILERERLLGTMAAEEIEGDADVIPEEDLSSLGANRD